EGEIADSGVRLRRPMTEISAYVPASEDLRLQRDILDKQIVDVHDYRVVRVNDVRLADCSDKLCLIGADASFRAIARRLGVGAPDVETGADTIEEMEDEEAAAVMETLEEERAADILEEMEPDNAADLLADLSDARSEELLEAMEPEEAADVKELLSYHEETAGGLMTTEFIAVEEGLTADETISKLRELSPKAETIYYIYVVDSEMRLAGVLSLRDL